ncbi:MAG TPA: amidohydrolase family protein [Allosphingosinicella sp.]|nr:amidohydrolase family protein [Allosphingosinicella sp.]
MTGGLHEFDLVIRDGTIADGTGGPLRRGDVGISGGRIAAVGEVAGAGAEELDAADKLVTPGFVDIHTHFDGQAIWDSRLSPTSWHGATTLVMGNCGVGFAPVRSGDRDKLVALMEGVEDIPNPCLAEGLDWAWESFADYLRAVERRPHDADLAALLPHAALRLYVMGDRALRLEAATGEDMAGMRALAAEAMRAGALGFSTSRTTGHRTLAGDPVPTLRAAEQELTAIALGMADAGHGVIEAISDWDMPDAESEFAMFRRIVEASGRPALISVTQRYHQPDVWRQVMRLAREAAADGVPMRVVVAPRPIGVLFGLEGTQNPFSGTRTYREFAHLPLAERVARMRDPEIRRRMLADDPLELSTFALLGRLSNERVFRLGDPPDYAPPRNQSVAAIAAREGRSAADVAYDLLLEDEGSALLFAPVVNYLDYDLSACREMIADPNALFGLGDGGAHVGFITDASFPTYLLSHWARDAEDGLELPEVVRRLTSANALAVGLEDRGLIAPGMKADLNVIDLPALRLGKPYLVHDLPAGGTRLMQKAEGLEATIVSGRITYRNGEPTAALPGRLVRGPQRVAA